MISKHFIWPFNRKLSFIQKGTTQIIYTARTDPNAICCELCWWVWWQPRLRLLVLWSIRENVFINFHNSFYFCSNFLKHVHTYFMGPVEERMLWFICVYGELIISYQLKSEIECWNSNAENDEIHAAREIFKVDGVGVFSAERYSLADLRKVFEF